MAATKRRRRLWVIGVYGLLVVAVPLSSPPSLPDTSARSEASAEGLLGLWQRFPAHSEGDLIRFWYFHPGGTGLYRYGRVGFTNTHSFDWQREGDGLRVTFRKTGTSHASRIRIEADAELPGRRWLVIESDPEESGAMRRYFQDEAAPGEPPPQNPDRPGGLGGRLWMDYREFETGGRGFALYQLREAGIDGRGTGWFHRGDFDDWTTEALSYRKTGDTLELQFSTTPGRELSSFRIEQRGRHRWLQLDRDPRDFWREHRYLDVGPSFGSAPNQELADILSDLPK